MKILLKTWQTYCPHVSIHDRREWRDLWDDVGIEVKQVVQQAAGAVATVELLANRGDHHAYIGIAREVCARLQAPLQLPTIAPLTFGTLPDRKINLLTDACLIYSLSQFEFDPTQPLPAFITETLTSTEEDTGIPIVDLTQFVSLEWGQPLHVFDTEKVTGAITVRLSKVGEQAHLLFTDAPQVIPEGTIVICDEKHILALAGIIGCVPAAVTDKTRSILVESALFDPVRIRIQARRLKLSTGASSRFERGGDPATVKQALGRLQWLLEQHVKGRKVGPTEYHEQQIPRPAPVSLQMREILSYFQLPLTSQEVQSRLAAYGFGIQVDHRQADPLFTVTIPSHRIWDVEGAPCLLEELSKSLGYNQLPTHMPVGNIGTSLPESYRKQWEISEYLAHLGFYEVILDSFYGHSDLQKMRFDPEAPLSSHVRIINSIDKAFSLLKNNALLQALTLVSHNARHGVDPIQAFEFTKLFVPHDQLFCEEKAILWGVVSGHTDKNWQKGSVALDVWHIKGIVQNIFHLIGQPIDFKTNATDAHPLQACLHPGRQATLWSHDKCVGILGEVHPHLRDSFDLKNKRPVYFEIDLALLHKGRSRMPNFHEPSEFLPIKRALAFHVPKGIETGALVKTLRTSAPDWLNRIHVNDYFESTKDGETIRAFTFELVFDHDNKRSAETINATLEDMRSAVLRAFENQGVKARV